MDNKAYWVGFNHIKGIGAVRLRRLLDFFGNLEIAWHAPLDGLTSAGLSEKIAANVLTFRNSHDLETIYSSLRSKGIQVITLEDENYPRRLKEIDQSPPMLYLKGSLLSIDDWSVAIVGTRRMTGYGKQVAGELASFLGSRGVSVISGLARGVDSIAHSSALEGGGRTIAVLGSGVDVIYPPEHRKLAESIIQRGAIISDYAPGTPPDGINFPPRNRIISGLSLATVVVEAGKKSGALITTTFAAEQGREVFSVPGNIYAAQSKGTNFLIQQGARPLVEFEEILDVLHMQNIDQYKQARTFLPENEIEKVIMSALGDQNLHVDEIQNSTSLPMSQVSSALIMLELKGVVYKTGNMNYALAREKSSDYGGDQ